MTTPAEERSHRDLFEQSLARCSANDQFMPRFYHYFLEESDDIREKFQFTDFKKQNLVLLQSLQLSAAATAGESTALRQLNDLARRHDRNHLDVDEHHYEMWLAAVLRAAEEFDDRWDADVAEAWNSILGFVVAHMIRSY